MPDLHHQKERRGLVALAPLSWVSCDIPRQSEFQTTADLDDTVLERTRNESQRKAVAELAAGISIVRVVQDIDALNTEGEE